MFSLAFALRILSSVVPRLLLDAHQRGQALPFRNFTFGNRSLCICGGVIGVQDAEALGHAVVGLGLEFGAHFLNFLMA